MEANRVTFRGRLYTAEQLAPGIIQVGAHFRFHQRWSLCRDVDAAHRWLGDHGLKRGRAKRLLANVTQADA